MTTAPIKPSRARRVCKWAGLVLSVLLAITWAASGWHSDMLGHGFLGGYGIAESTRGHLTLAFTTDRVVARMLRDIAEDNVVVTCLNVRGTPESASERLITHWPEWRASPGMWLLTVPYWIPFAASTCVTLAMWRRCKAGGIGLCRRCGYDVAGLPLYAPCPECGAARDVQIPPPSERLPLSASSAPLR